MEEFYFPKIISTASEARKTASPFYPCLKILRLQKKLDPPVGRNKVFRLHKTLFIQVFVFIHPGVCFYFTTNNEPG